MATNYTLRIDAGAHYFLTVIWVDPDEVPIDMTGYSARMMLKNKYSDTTPLVSLTSASGITITPEEGVIEIVISDENTGTLATTKEGRGVYDLEVESADGIVTRLLGGEWIASPETTK